MRSKMRSFILLVCLFEIYSASGSIIGVPLEKLSFYDKSKDFRCLDGSQSIPFTYVNDDYCDCADGTDEPGTSACDNSEFYCENKEHEPHYLQSSRVNDGICDCCDGTDEWDSEVTCPNTCIELGRKVKEERRRLQDIEEAGFQKRSEYIAQGRQKKEEYERDLSDVENDLGVVNSEVEMLRQAKEEAEEPESQKKEEHQKRWEEEKALMKEEKRKKEAQNMFKVLDTNSNNEVSIDEIMARGELDDDGDATVSVEEAEVYLDGNRPIDFDTFLEKSWDLVSSKFKEAKEKEIDVPGNEEGNDNEDIHDDEDDEDKDDDDEDDEDRHDDDDDSETLEMPPYDEETQQLIEVANSARQSFKDAESRKRSLESRKSELEKYLNVGLGHHHEFSPLYEQCFEFTDREYTYKLCLFDKVTQRSKNGGRETSLGNWDKWAGTGDNLHSAMLYSKGERCWNGPDRSTTVNFICGLNDEIISAHEPNKCEYAMVFTTPARCKGQVDAKPNKLKIEL